MVGRTPWSAADALVGLPASCKMLISSFRLRVQGDPRGPGGPPHQFGGVPVIGQDCPPSPVSIAVNYIDSSGLTRLKFAHGTVTDWQHARPILQTGKVERAAGKDVT